MSAPEDAGPPTPEDSRASLRERAAGELAEALLPALRRFLVHSTGELEALEQALAGSQHAHAEDELLRNVEACRAESRAYGWCLGVLAAAAGTDLLLARRERDGLRELVELVALALGDRALSPPAAELPMVASEHGDGWELPFLVAWLFLRAGVTPPSDGPLRWGLLEHDTRQTFLVACDGRPDLAPLASLAALVEGAAPVEEDDAFGVVLPAGRLVAR